MVSAVARIKKRDGTVTDFNQDKITNAIFKAMQTQGIKDRAIAKNASDIVSFMIEEKFGG
jgi:ribonucleoside-diphosphate reductase alpha chain